MPSGTKLWVGNVPYGSTQDELETLFLQYGKIASVTFREGFSFIEFESEAEANTAKAELHETTYQGRKLQVEFARSDGPRPRGGDRERSAPDSPDSGSRHLYVARIPETVTLDELRDFFARHGNGMAPGAARPRALGPRAAGARSLTALAAGSTFPMAAYA